MRARAVVPLLAAALGVAACSGTSERSLPKPGKEFCLAAHRYEERIQSKRPPSIDAQITMVERIAAAAPPDVRTDARTFLAAMRRVATDRSLKDDPKVKAAVDNVNRRAGNGCDFYRSESGTGM